jgi:chemotaxis protein CheD
MTSRHIFVKVAQAAVAAEGEMLVTLGLGSCVAIVLHDPERQAGGLAHVLLPEPALSRDTSNPAKFASTAVPLLVERLAARGSRPEALVGRLVGGASMFATLMVPGSLNMGERNVRAAREALEAAGIGLLGEAVGGEKGRSVRFWPGDGRVIVSSVGRDDVHL